VPTFLTAVVAAITGAVITWLYLLSRQAGQTERLRSREEENNRLTSELATLRTESTRLSTLATELQTKLAAERDTQARLSNEFKALSADALKANNTSFLALAAERFAQLQQSSAGDLEKRQLAIDALVKPLKESLQQVDTKIAAIENARKEAYGSLTEQLKGLALAQTSLQSETTKLSRSLRSTSTAGRWGEIQLQRVVELAGMLENVDFIQQEATGEVRPDMIIRLPGGKSIAVDAKAPMQAFLEALEASDENVRKAKFAEHARVVRGHIDALGNKSYWKNIQPSPEFVVLFIPGEAFYSAALRYEPDLFERGTAVGVILASPATLIAPRPPPTAGNRRRCPRTPTRSAASASNSTNASARSPATSTISASACSRPSAPTTAPPSRPRASSSSRAANSRNSAAAARRKSSSRASSTKPPDVSPPPS